MTTPPPTGKPFYSVREAAALLCVSPATLYRAIREQAFPAVRIMSRYVIPAKAIDQLVEAALAGERGVDLNQLVADRRAEREIARLHPQWR